MGRTSFRYADGYELVCKWLHTVQVTDKGHRVDVPRSFKRLHQRLTKRLRRRATRSVIQEQLIQAADDGPTPFDIWYDAMMDEQDRLLTEYYDRLDEEEFNNYDQYESYREEMEDQMWDWDWE